MNIEHYPAEVIYNYLCKKNNISFELKHIQCLLYFINGWYISEFNIPLINEDFMITTISTIEDLFIPVRDDKQLIKIEPFDDNIPYLKSINDIYRKYYKITTILEDITDSDKTIIDNIYNIYKNIDMIRLAQFTKLKGTPIDIIKTYYKTINKPIPNNYKIPNKLISWYFSNEIKENHSCKCLIQSYNEKNIESKIPALEDISFSKNLQNMFEDDKLLKILRNNILDNNLQLTTLYYKKELLSNLNDSLYDIYTQTIADKLNCNIKPFTIYDKTDEDIVIELIFLMPKEIDIDISIFKESVNDYNDAMEKCKSAGCTYVFNGLDLRTL